MKLKLSFILSLMICPLVANQIMIPKQQTSVTRSKKLDQPDVCRSGVVDDELIDFDELNLDENINTQELIPLWARLANKVAAPFFVFYNNFSKWWSSEQQTLRLKKTRYIKRF